MATPRSKTLQKYLHALPDADRKNLDALNGIVRRDTAHTDPRDPAEQNPDGQPD